MENNLAYSEIYELFEILGDDYKNKIPKTFWDFVDKNMVKNYDKDKMRTDIENKKMSDEAMSLFAALNIKYLCEDELEKKLLLEIYKHNDNK